MLRFLFPGLSVLYSLFFRKSNITHGGSTQVVGGRTRSLDSKESTVLTTGVGNLGGIGVLVFKALVGG